MIAPKFSQTQRKKPMNQLIPKKDKHSLGEDIQALLVGGDMNRLTADQRMQYYMHVCGTIGLNYATRPFDFIVLNGKLVMYANKGCAEQLRSIKNISIKITSRETIEGVYIVTADAQAPDGRVDSSTGAVPISNLKGEQLANAMMKAETKAKRRVTLSLCGLNMLDETEVDSIPESQKIRPEQAGPAKVLPEDPGEGNGFTPEGYRIPFGKYAKRSIEDVDVGHLKDYVSYLERTAEKNNKPMREEARDFVERASNYLASLENDTNFGDDVS
jgi:hypothetical protein